MVGHRPIVRGASFAGAMSAPVILRRTDSNFLNAILSGLKTADGRAALADTLADTRDSSGVLKLFQPVHQVFQVALLELCCDSLRNPRLDPVKIDSCGLVVRRISDTPGVMERWSKSGDQIAGWVPCADDDFEPDPARRRPRVTSGNAEIDRRLTLPASAYDPYSEAAVPLFPAPPEVCVAAGTTVLYGVVPVTSREKSEAAVNRPVDIATVQQLLPYFLTPGGSRTIPLANQTVSASDVSGNDAGASLLNNLRALSAEFDLFGQSAEGAAFLQALNRLSVSDALGNVISGLGDFLKRASATLVAGNAGSITMPAAWPPIDQPTGDAIATLAQTALQARVGAMMTGEGRFEDPARQYRLRAFARVKRPDGCPPILVWSSYSEPFTIASWYESSGQPPVRITLPSMGADFLKNLKPNVAFAMPEDLFNTMQRDAKKAVAGQATTPGNSSLGLMWLCSFNIPVITICAFIVLNIFLSLVDLFLNWMLFIKICIPIPVPKKNG
jgi:hypothetical protein